MQLPTPQLQCTCAVQIVIKTSTIVAPGTGTPWHANNFAHIRELCSRSATLCVRGLSLQVGHPQKGSDFFPVLGACWSRTYAGKVGRHGSAVRRCPESGSTCQCSNCSRCSHRKIALSASRLLSCILVSSGLREREKKGGTQRERGGGREGGGGRA